MRQKFYFPKESPESGVQLTLAPENLTTLAHFSVSSTTNLANWAGVIDIGSAPRSASRAFNLGFTRAALISLLSFSTISLGAFFGTPTPAQNTDSAPGTKSPMVGMSGSASERVAAVTARGRSLPDLMYSIVPGMVPKITCTCPASKSVSAGASPRYGTWIMLTMILNSSPERWPPDPTPADAM